jgi:hypothetical protein
LANKDEVMKAIEGFVVDKAELVGVYKLKK